MVQEDLDAGSIRDEIIDELLSMFEPDLELIIFDTFGQVWRKV